MAERDRKTKISNGMSKEGGFIRSLATLGLLQEFRRALLVCT